LAEKGNAYIITMSGMQHTVSEGDILGKASWNAEKGKWQIDPL